MRTEQKKDKSKYRVVVYELETNKSKTITIFGNGNTLKFDVVVKRIKDQIKKW